MGGEGLADADGSDDGDVRVGLEKAQRDQLVPQLGVVTDLGGRVPGLDLVRGIEAGTLGPELGRDAVAPRDLVGEDQQEEVLVGHLLLPGEGEAIWQRVEDRPQLEALEDLFQIGGDDVLSHDGSPVVMGVEGSANCWAGRRNLPGGSVRVGAGLDSATADSSMRRRRCMLSMSWASAVTQVASTRSAP